MGFDPIVFAALALVLGFKHAFDADHVVAVSQILSRRKTLDSSVALAASWAAGHLVTASLVAVALYFFADTFLSKIVARLDLLVPIMLILVGLLALGFEFRRFHVHRHRHASVGAEHAHFHLHLKPSHEHGAMVGIGVVHGLASNDELLLVLFTGLLADSWIQVVGGVALFSVGVLSGMVLYSAGLTFAGSRIKSNWVAPALNVTFAVLSIGYAVYLLAGGEGLNLLERLVRVD